MNEHADTAGQVPGPKHQDWSQARRKAAAERSRMLANRQLSEQARAARIVAAFLSVAHQEGLEPVELRARGYRGGSARTGLRGWYLRVDKTVAIDVEGGYYLLSVPLSLRERVMGVRLHSEPVPMTIGEGGRDGDVVPLRFALNRLLPGWEERCTEPLT